jgi:hypothetical protein
MDPLEFVYKRVDPLELKLDVYLPADASQEKPSPICIWWHGGGRKSLLLSSTAKGLIYQCFRYVHPALGTMSETTGNQETSVSHFIRVMAVVKIQVSHHISFVYLISASP